MRANNHMELPLIKTVVRLGVFASWVYLTVTISEVIYGPPDVLLVDYQLIALFSLCSGALMLSFFQSAGWIRGPLFSERKIDYTESDSE